MSQGYMSQVYLDITRTQINDGRGKRVGHHGFANITVGENIESSCQHYVADIMVARGDIKSSCQK